MRSLYRMLWGLGFGFDRHAGGVQCTSPGQRPGKLRQQTLASDILISPGIKLSPLGGK
jgi:hypothetical protein